ncbi:DUF1800 domain-containing protein [Uliginosibacterium sp. H3]|uniref:DUF1800 domain-containing protein n=1 Tax=Uliginosibacterium silvisoli TaxID=3114758 RepID=A0ABU6K0Q6_9RHOO|nr:DUF1800 domain-containing protein [Uliginosibacterium sp. H3]
MSPGFSRFKHNASASLLALLLGSATLLSGCANYRSWPDEPRNIARPSGVVAAAPAPSVKEASRFLQQATFGPNMSEIEALSQSSYAAWLNQQFALPQTRLLPIIEPEHARLEKGKNLNQELYFRAFWKTAATAPDQLRQRVAFALSEIFVISMEGMLDVKMRAVSSYQDMLARNAFGDFRTLIEEVSRHPAMGVYLSHIKNMKEDPSKGRVPDENYAREIMQLFTIGLYELNTDGTPKMKNGQALETYDNEDITGLAKVFTGFSYNAWETTDANFFNAGRTPDWEIKPMFGYPQFHSTSAKSFLGVTIPASKEAEPDADLKIAMDRLFNHPNVGPFFGRQLIQRLVTSNPSPAYVRRVAEAFNNNGAGVRGDMQAVVRAVLLDPEARSAASLKDKDFGKVREPVLRLSQWMRAFHATSPSGEFQMYNTDNPGNALGQSPMRSPTVFNFFRPGYVPPGTQLASANMVAPEMQIVSESSVAGYANFIQSTVESGTGKTLNGKRDIQPDYSEQMALAGSPEKLVEHLDLLLTAGQLSPVSRKRIVDAVAGVGIPANNPTNAENARRNRVKLGILLTMVSPEYLVQK